MRHLVPVFFTFRKGSHEQSSIITAFVLSISDQWFLVSAGHCLDEIEENIKRGYKISNCRLVDSLGLGAKYYDSIPFDYEGSFPVRLSGNPNFDYGFIYLTPYYRRLLEKNNIQPLDEEVWKKQPSKVDFYALIGLAQELTTVTSESMEARPSLHRIIPLDAKPEGFPQTEISLFYGRVLIGGPVRSIKGMSGGPILAFHQEEDGHLKYWLIALQSSWLPQSRYICAYPTKLLADWIDGKINGHQRK